MHSTLFDFIPLSLWTTVLTGTKYPVVNVEVEWDMLSTAHYILNTKYKEHKPQDIAVDQLEDLNYEIDALIAAREIDIDHAEAIMRVEIGSKVNSMSSMSSKKIISSNSSSRPKFFLYCYS